MNTNTTMFSLLISCLVLSSCGEPKMPRSDDKQAMRARVMERFDKDGDGVLNEQERAEARAAREARGGARPPRGGGRQLSEEQKKRMLERFDKDGDGRLNEEERAAARAARPRRGAPQQSTGS